MAMRSTGHRLYGSHIYEGTGEHPYEPEISSPGRGRAKTRRATLLAEQARTTAHRLYGSHVGEEIVQAGAEPVAEPRQDAARARRRAALARRSRLAVAGKR